MDQWSISSLEYQQSEVHFIALQPDNGLITGDKARPFLLKSGLPPQILAQVKYRRACPKGLLMSDSCKLTKSLFRFGRSRI